MFTAEQLTQRAAEFLPGHLGVVVTHASAEELRCELAVKKFLMAPSGYMHAGTVVTLADTAAGFGCLEKTSEPGRAIPASEPSIPRLTGVHPRRPSWPPLPRSRS